MATEFVRYDPFAAQNIIRAVHDVESQIEQDTQIMLTEARYLAAEQAIAPSQQAFLRGGRALGRTYANNETLLRGEQAIYRNEKIAYAGAAQTVANASMKMVVEAALLNGDADLGNKMATIIDNFRNISNRRVGLKTKMDELALQARKATLVSFTSKVARSEYRAGLNRLVGSMEHALGRDSWAVGTSSGVLFGNIAVLDVEAANWHRLNFGAGGRGRATPAPANGTMFFSLENRAPGETGTPLFNFGLHKEPSPDFIIPQGVFLGKGNAIAPFGKAHGPGDNTREAFYTRAQYFSEFGAGQELDDLETAAVQKHFSSYRGNAFLGAGRPLVGKQTRIRNAALFGKRAYARISLGITGVNYMDAGVTVLRQGIPRVMAEVFNGWFEEASRGVGPLAGSG